MNQDVAQPTSNSAMEARIVRYDDLRPCYNAFIDTRSPGSEAKENFTIIGPGVSENPAQFVHIAEAHGFNIGGARQPPGCVNSQHSHNTAEVFVVHMGKWRFDLGETGDDAQVELNPGDAISIPTNVFRGFTNIGDDLGYLWAVLGEDNPGRVLWAPDVFDMAQHHGLVLLENGSLVDTLAGEQVPHDIAPMPVTTREQIEALDRYTNEQAEKLVVHDDAGAGLIIGEGAQLAWPHGFTLERIDLSGNTLELDGAYVLFVQSGDALLESENGASTLGRGDTISVPADLGPHKWSSQDAVLYIVRRTAD